MALPKAENENELKNFSLRINLKFLKKAEKLKDAAGSIYILGSIKYLFYR